ncbi:MAG: hypothetical protein IPH52_20035 [Leptospiraceae bacterium]|nr:hypothetical protein [Leptospiraceae bacterium]
MINTDKETPSIAATPALGLSTNGEFKRLTFTSEYPLSQGQMFIYLFFLILLL